MAVVNHPISIHRYIGASTDTKPTIATPGNVQPPVEGSTFYEHDTGVMYITYDGTNWVVKGDRIVFQNFTSATALAEALAPGLRFRLLRIEAHWSAAPSDSEAFTVTCDAGDGAGYDILLDSVDPSVGSQTDLVFIYGKGYEFESDDAIDIAYTNTGTDTISGRYVYELI